MFQQVIHVADAEAMERLGARLAGAVGAGDRVYLSGGLGCGKTTLVRGMLRAFGIRGAIKSPTYTIVEPYRRGELDIYHFDLYRIKDLEELEALGWRDYLSENALILIEWPALAERLLGPPELALRIVEAGAGRDVYLGSETELKSLLFI